MSKSKIEITFRLTSDLIPYARNSRTHDEGQVAQIAGSIKEFGFTNPVLIDNDNGIIAGHGRVMAAQRLKMKDVPCIVLGHLTEAQKRAYVIADNKLALNAGWNEELLALELSDLREAGFDLGLTGFDEEAIESALNSDDPKNDLSADYTHKVEAPVYEPKGDRPAVSELVNRERANQLAEKIEKSDIPPDVAEFLKVAASRHMVFDYGKIAEFYCHADEVTQELMEDSALVIIDFKKALQLGYAKLQEEIAEAIQREQEESGNEK